MRFAKHGIEYPNAQDNDSKTWDLYGIRFWPSFVLIDKKGNIRYEGYGEFHVGDASYRLWSRPDRGAAPGMRAATGFAFVLACSSVGDRTVPPLQVSHSVEGDGTRLALVASPGIRINARLKPALELADGTILRFDSPRLTAGFGLLRRAAVHAGRHAVEGRPRDGSGKYLRR